MSVNNNDREQIINFLLAKNDERQAEIDKLQQELEASKKQIQNLLPKDSGQVVPSTGEATPGA